MKRRENIKAQVVVSIINSIQHLMVSISTSALHYRDHDIQLLVNLLLEDIQNSGQGNTLREVI
jgi:hypothetical protein